ncbi:MAG TPA: endonuclease [Gammaproteobacteria bacterium]|nr:endonuclease [Gammaproteobacteria bacterium]HAU06673.1 endonuclease [Gammaproteobacteria bacterium]
MTLPNDWYVYIIETHNGKLYTGITTDVRRRFIEHQGGNKQAKFFHSSPAKKVVFIEQHPSRSAASKREYAIKKLSKPKKLTLIQTAIACIMD